MLSASEIIQMRLSSVTVFQRRPLASVPELVELAAAFMSVRRAGAVLEPPKGEVGTMPVAVVRFWLSR